MLYWFNAVSVRVSLDDLPDLPGTLVPMDVHFGAAYPDSYWDRSSISLLTGLRLYRY